MPEPAGWFLALEGKPQGPLPLAELLEKLRKTGGPDTLVYGPGLADWTEVRHVESVWSQLRPVGAPPPVPKRKNSDEIDYEIFGHEMQYVEVVLDPNEMVVAEAGALMYMTSEVQMQTVFGDPSKQEQGFFSKLATAGKRLLTGESLFMTTFTARGARRQTIAFAAPYPGKILAMDLDRLGGELICQKDSFLCAARGVQIGIAFQKKLGVGLFGGEGFIMQRLTGDGIAMVHAGGSIAKKTLAPGETLKVDTGCLVALMPTVTYDIEFVGGFKNTLFGGEGLFFAALRGPGDVWLQSLPFSRLAGRIYAAAPNAGGSRREEGSLLGGLGGLLDGDNT